MTTRNGVRTPRRQRKWVELRHSNQSVVSGGQSNNSLLASGIEHVKATIAGVIIQMSFNVPSGETAGEIALLEYGIVTVNEDAASAAAFPDPNGPDQVPWLVKDHVLMISEGVTIGPLAVNYRTYRLKAQRVVRDASTRLSFVVNNTPIAGAFTVNYYLTGRVLLLLP